jgi:uncharacterized phiE125 gp8 family phage protein
MNQCTYKIIDTKLDPSDLVVTLDDIKSHLRITFTDDDTYLPILGAGCQARIERHCGISFSERTVTLQVTDINGDIFLPYGPIISVTSVTDSDGNVLVANTDYVLQGVEMKFINKTNQAILFNGKLTIVYQGGFDDVPPDLQMALLNEIAYRYENRGDQIDVAALSSGAQMFANPYRQFRYI